MRTEAMPVTARRVKEIAAECGFEIAGVVSAAPLSEHAWYREWAARGMAGSGRSSANRIGQRAALRVI